MLGLRRGAAARFIFLLGIPAILGAAVRELPVLASGGGGPEAAVLFPIGLMTSAVVGYAAIALFIRYLANHTLQAFAWYRLALAACVVVWTLR
jgi:undecaprenyl-diphosphatase